MQRRTYLGGVAVLAALTAVVTGCSGVSGQGGGAGDGTSGTSAEATPAAPPGRYRTLPEPCGALGRDVLRGALFPGTESDGAGAEAVVAALEGEAAVTYDTDRRVGCSWKSSTALGSRHLTVDLERVVSYDPTVSDNDQAAELYEERAAEADIPETPPPTEPASDEPTDGATDGTADGGATDGASPVDAPGAADGTTERTAPEPDADATGGPARDGATGAPPPDPALAPRPLEGVGETAYLDDELVTADAGVHRDITLVFRTGNVIVTVEYDQWSTDKRRLPDSGELQEQALRLARQLAERLES
ncbi:MULTISPECIES: hypothetical protein [Streptomyces]|uniref:hypothetical protein n=1 Tax=Streptomyces TaxID=1883 RepID=UPI002248B12C|nr:hypothetical protein [Streptomyces sp. JHD 1]MCX2968918.1 hypothetical protein [Streptomyces sp. JHD 1]